jgi:transposase InsO family protein
VEEVEGAERSWLLSVQRGMETDGSLKHLETHLNLFQDEFGVLRCRSRLENSDLVETQKFPVILPRKNNLTELIIMDAHRRALHMGSNSTIALVRTKFWVPKLRQLVRQLLRNCIVCRKLNGKAYPPQPAPPLPKFRVVFEEPFSSTGLDFAGPLYIKTKCAQNPFSKVYFLLLTCSASRAIHLELVPDMTSSSCVRALRRFIARRGVPNLIFSDNAKTFKAAETKAFALDRGIKWRYNLTEAPWTGGVFERMIGVTKRSLRKVLGRACVTYEELETILVEVESIINDRPISYIDTSDTSEALTPNHLLYGRRLAALVDEASKCSDDVGGSCNLSRRYLYRLRLIEQAKRKWKSEYLLELRLWVKRARLVSSSIKVGDIVLVEDRVPRTMWPLARVESLIISGDGLVRGARVRLGLKQGSSNSKSTLVERPIQKLYPLETKLVQHSGETGPGLTERGSKGALLGDVAQGREAPLTCLGEDFIRRTSRDIEATSSTREGDAKRKDDASPDDDATRDEDVVRGEACRNIEKTRRSTRAAAATADFMRRHYDLK